MKSCRDLEHLLDDFVDGTAPPAERPQIEQHLSGCAACRRVVEEMRALLTATARLDREIAAPEDLWPAIRAAVEPRSQRTGVRWMALAASLLVVILAGSTALWLRDGDVDSTPADGSPRGGTLPASHPLPAWA